MVLSPRALQVQRVLHVHSPVEAFIFSATFVKLVTVILELPATGKSPAAIGYPSLVRFACRAEKELLSTIF